MEVKEGDKVNVASIGTTRIGVVLEIDDVRERVRVQWVTGGRKVYVERDRILGVVRSAEEREAIRARLRERDAEERTKIPETLPPPPPRPSARFGEGLRAVPKPLKPARSERYLAFVRAKSCCSCKAAGPSDPHHFGGRGMGQKTDDFRTVPLCRFCHDQWHQRAVLPKMDEKTSRVFMLQKQVDLLVEFLRCELAES